MARPVGDPTSQKSIRLPDGDLEYLVFLAKKYDRPVAWLMRRFIQYVLSQDDLVTVAIAYIPKEKEEDGSRQLP